jgi:hypothetical protein
MREAARADALAEVRDGLRIAEKILKAHGLSLLDGRWRGEVALSRLISLRPEIPKHQRRKKDARRIRIPHDVPVCEDSFRFANQSLNPVSIKLVSEIVIGAVPFLLKTNESACHGGELGWDRTH